MAASPASPALHRLSTFKDGASSTAAAVATTSPLENIAGDPILSAFLSPDFSATRFSSDALSAGSAAARAEHLQDAIGLLHSQIRSEVLSRHPHLLSHLSSLSDAHSALSLLRSSLSSLRSSLLRLRLDLSDPHRSLRILSTQLSHLHEASILLHATVRLLRLSRKLRDLVAESPSEKLDLSKAAQLHREILAVAAESGLDGVAVVDEELAWLAEVGARIRAEGARVLDRGLEGLNQAEVGSGLQVFYNLGELKECVEGLVGKYKNQGVKSVGSALDLKLVSASAAAAASGGFAGPGSVHRSGTPQIGGGARAKEALWQRLVVCMDQIHSIVVAVWHLQRVLSKKRDPFTHVLFLEEVLQVCVFDSSYNKISIPCSSFKC